MSPHFPGIASVPCIMHSVIRRFFFIGIITAILIVVLARAFDFGHYAYASVQDVVTVTTVSAASFEGPVAPDSIAAIFGENLAPRTEVATSLPLPTTLAGTTVTIQDSLSVIRPAQLFFVAPTQINCLIPASTAAGEATIRVETGGGEVFSGTVQIAIAAPSIFAANANGRGVVAADLIRVMPDLSQRFESPVEGTYPDYIARPIDLGPETEQVFLALYLTGLRGMPDTDGDTRNGAAENVRVLIGGLEVTPIYAGIVPGFTGLDQINVAIPRALIGRGRVSLAVLALGFGTSNEVEIDLAVPQGFQPPTVTGIVAPTNVLARDEIVINGSQFSTNPGDLLVRIGGIEASLESASSTQLKVRVPFGVITGPITLSTSGGHWRSDDTLPVRTSISGFIRDTSDQPIVGAKVRLLGSSSFVTTPAEGWFVLPDTPSGSAINFKVEIPPSGPLPYPGLPLKMSVAGQRDNPYHSTIYLQQVSGPSIQVGGGFGRISRARTQADPSISISGITFTLPPSGVIATFPDGSTSGTLTLDTLQNSLTPVKLPPRIFSSAIAQITPFGVILEPGGKLTFPNTDRFPAGTLVKLFKYDLTPSSSTFGTFIDTGKQALVSSDGAKIETEAGAITETSYYFVALPQPLTTIVGRVLDSDGVTPVRGAITRARGQEAVTDGNGGFVLRNVPANGNEQVNVAASLLRPSGRIDQASGRTEPVIVGGLTKIANLILPAATSNRSPVIYAPANVNVSVTDTREFAIVVTDLDADQQIGEVKLSGPNFAQLVKTEAGDYRLRISPPLDSEDVYALIIQASDSTGASTHYETKLSVRPLPLASAQSITIAEDTSVQIKLSGSDPDNKSLFYSLKNTPKNGHLIGAPPNLTYVPELNFNGQDSFTFVVSNGSVTSAEATVAITVQPVNDPPALVVPSSITVNIGQPISFSLTAIDPDVEDTITFAAAALPAGAQFSPSSHNFTWTPTAAQVGTYSISFIVTDNGQPPLSDFKTVAITVNGSGPWRPTSGPYGAIKAFLNTRTTLFAAVEGAGIFRSTDNGNTWTSVNQGLYTTSVRAFTLVPVATGNSIIYAGTDSGVFRSSDNGDSWSSVNAGLANLDVRAISNLDGTVFAGTEGSGVFLLNNFDDTWFQANNGLENLSIRAFAVLGGRLCAATGAGVFRESNHGALWTAFSSGLQNLSVLALALYNTPVGTSLIAGTEGGGVFLSAGQSWISLNSGIEGEIVSSLAVSGNILFAGTRDGGVYRYNLLLPSSGWTAINEGLGNRFIIALFANDAAIFAGTQGSGIFRSINVGDDWSPINQGILQARVTYLQASNQNLYAATAGSGIFLTNDEGTTWIARNNGLTNLAITSIAANGAELYASTLGDGVFRSTDNGANWVPVNSGLTSLYIRSLAINESTIFAGTEEFGIFRSTDNGANWVPVNNGLDHRPIYAIAAVGGQVFAGMIGSGVFRSTDNGVSWTLMNNGLASLNVSSFVVIDDVLYVGTFDGGVFRSTDMGMSWTAVNNGLANINIYSLAASGTTIYAGTNGGGVFRSIDNGENWTPVNQGLNDPYVRSLAVSGAALFSGTSNAGVLILK